MSSPMERPCRPSGRYVVVGQWRTTRVHFSEIAVFSVPIDVPHENQFGIFGPARVVAFEPARSLILRVFHVIAP